MKPLTAASLLLFYTALGFSQSSNPSIANFSTIEPAFSSILGPSPSITLLYNASDPLFHEAAIYISEVDDLYVTSNRINLTNGQVDAATTNQTILLHRLTNVSSSDLSAIELQAVADTSIPLPNGGTNHLGTTGIVLTAQGTKDEAGGLFNIPDPINAPNISVPIVTSFYGRQFNSPNDVAVNPVDNYTLWFTDPDYGYQQGLRNAPVLPNQVYRYDPATNSTRVVADGFVEPNGLAFSLDYSQVYITDTGSNTIENGPSTIYLYDVQYHPGPFLFNRRVFAFAPHGIPDGIKVDTRGNVYSGTGDGVTVWDPSGLLLGEILIDGGVANFGFGKNGLLFVMGEKLLWRVQLDQSLAGALLGPYSGGAEREPILVVDKFVMAG